MSRGPAASARPRPTPARSGCRLAPPAQAGLDLPFALDASVPPGTPLVFQFWISDPAATFGLSASNGMLGVVP
jgi:hypothetical protein